MWQPNYFKLKYAQAHVLKIIPNLSVSYSSFIFTTLGQ